MDELAAAGRFLQELEQRAEQAERGTHALLTAEKVVSRRGLSSASAARALSSRTGTMGGRSSSSGRRPMPSGSAATTGGGDEGGGGGVDADAIDERAGAFLRRFKVKARSQNSTVFIQSWWRMKRQRVRMQRWQRRRSNRLWMHFRAWMACTNAKLCFEKMLKKWTVREWSTLVDDSRRTRHVAFAIFQKRMGRGLSIAAVNLFFSDDLLEVQSKQTPSTDRRSPQRARATARALPPPP